MVHPRPESQAAKPMRVLQKWGGGTVCPNGERSVFLCFFCEIGCFWYLIGQRVFEMSSGISFLLGSFLGGCLARGVGGTMFVDMMLTAWYLIDFFWGGADFGVTAQLLWIYVMSTHNLVYKNSPHKWCESTKFGNLPTSFHPTNELNMGFKKCHAFSTHSKMLIHWHCVFQFLEHWPDSKNKSKPFEKHSVLTSYSPLFFGNIFRFSAQTPLFTSTTIADPADLQLEDMTCFSESQQCIKLSSGNSNFRNVILLFSDTKKSTNWKWYVHVFTSFFGSFSINSNSTKIRGELHHSKKLHVLLAAENGYRHIQWIYHMYTYVCSTCHLIFPPEV